MNYTQHTLSFILNTTWDQIPTEVRHQSKRCLLDTLGALLAGMNTPVGRLMTNIGTDQFRGEEATILVSGRRTSATGAALANGFAANALDIDDGYRLIKGHPGACVLPAILAAGEMAGECSGETFLTAMIIGYEIAIRAGLIRHRLYPIYHSSGSWGAISGSAAAGRILGLDRARLMHALGTAEYHAPIAPMMKGIETPSMGKDSIGWGAMAGVLSTILAQKGFTGIQPLFEDSPENDWISGLGSRYEIMNVYFKPYAACRWAQPAVAGALKLKKDLGLTSEQIRQIRVMTFDAATRLPCTHPKNTEEAQYNLAFPIAAALIDGEVGPAQVLPPRIYNQQILSLADKVRAEVSGKFEAAFPEKTFAEVSIQTVNGKEFPSGPIEPKWERSSGLPSDENLESKFRWLVEPVLGKEKTGRLETTESIRNLLIHCIA